MIGKSELELIHFTNQPANTKDLSHSIPDAEISGDFKILIETKFSPNKVSVEQIEKHLKIIGNKPNYYLIILTPDKEVSGNIKSLVRDQVIWVSFNDLNNVIDGLFEEEDSLISEKEAFLLRNYKYMLLEEGLIYDENDVLVIPARFAWKEYEDTSSYICQANRTFRKTDYMAFYRDGVIQEYVPRIIKVFDSVLFMSDGTYKINNDELNVETEEGFKKELKEIALYMSNTKKIQDNEQHKVILLSAKKDDKTIKLKNVIPNDLIDKNGNKTAFVQGQRYVSLQKLLNSKTTTELVSIGNHELGKKKKKI